MQPAMIPYHIREMLLQLEPGLEPDWKNTLESIFSETDTMVWAELNQQFLKPREILWNADEHSFSYTFTTSLSVLKHCLNHQVLQQIANDLHELLEVMKLKSSAFEIAEQLDTGLQIIQSVYTADDQAAWREKILVLKTFLIQSAQTVQGMRITPPDGVRQLTEQQLKSYIVNIFLRYHWPDTGLKPQFKSIELLRKHPFFRYYLNKAQKSRHLQLIRSADFIFILAPFTEEKGEPYALHRFLSESKNSAGQPEFNGLVLDLHLSLENDYVEHFQQQVQHIPELRHKVSEAVCELLEQINQVCEQHIFPLLTESVHLEEKSADVFVQTQLKELENTLTEKLLMPVCATIRHAGLNQSEMNCVYWEVQRLLSEIYGYFCIFRQQPALMSNSAIKPFESRLLALIRLIQKRKHHIFVPVNAEAWSEAQAEAAAPVQGIQRVLNICLPEYRELKIRLNKLRREWSEARNSLLKRMIKGDQYEKDMQRISEELQLLKRQMYTDIRRVIDTSGQSRVYLETESTLSFKEAARHYAFPCGDNGLTCLPVVLKLPESFLDFDVEAFSARFSYDQKFSEGSRVMEALEDNSVQSSS